MKCPHCSADAPPQAQFCLRCGTPLVSGTASLPENRPAGLERRPVSPVVALAPNKPLLMMLGALVAAVAILAIAIFLMARSRALSAPADSHPVSALQAPAMPNSAAPVQAPAETPPPIAPVQAAASGPPQDVLDYLEWVRRTEEEKQRIIADQDSALGAASTGVDVLGQIMHGTEDLSPAGDPSLKKLAETMKAKIDPIINGFQALTAKFLTRQPPPSCVGLRDRYQFHMGRLQARVTQTYLAIEKMGQDQQGALRDLKGIQNADLDADGKVADDEVASICHRFGITKSFDIKGDSNPLGGIGKLLGL